MVTDELIASAPPMPNVRRETGTSLLSNSWTGDPPWLHIYAQYSWHDPAEIEGNRTALAAVRDAIDRALSTGMDTEAEAFAADGEGYQVVVRVRSREYLEASGRPYTATYARQKRSRP